MVEDKKTLPAALWLALGGLPVLITVALVLFFHQPTVYRCPMYIDGEQMSHRVPMETLTTPDPATSSDGKSSGAKKLGVLTAAAVELGAGLFEQSCASCHGQSGRADATTASKLPVPPEDLNSWAVHWRKDTDLYQAVSDHGDVTPLYSVQFSPEERWALVHYVRKTFSPEGSPPWNSLKGKSPVATGKVAYETLNCDRCHSNQRPRTLAGFPPTLDNVGSKLNRDWIVDYLLKPYPIRWESMGVRPLMRMPSFKLQRQTAEALADYLAAQIDTARFSEAALEEQGDVKEGKSLFKSYQCLGCHSLQGKGNKIGPDLTKAGVRLKPAYIFQWVKDPQGLIPGTAMKDYELWDDEASSLVRYLETLK
jgi:mono/diheme cytochrome c family protein